MNLNNRSDELQGMNHFCNMMQTLDARISLLEDAYKTNSAQVATNKRLLVQTTDQIKALQKQYEKMHESCNLFENEVMDELVIIRQQRQTTSHKT